MPLIMYPNGKAVIIKISFLTLFKPVFFEMIIKMLTKIIRA